MNSELHCDLAIIGGGAGGLSLAAGASQMGAKVILVEAGKMGGDCLNFGCVPSKSLLAAAKTYQQTQTANKFGIDAKTATLNFTEVMQHVQKVINTIAKHDSKARFEKLGVKVIKATGKFIDRKTIAAGKYQLKAKHFVIATGSAPFVPPIPGVDKVPYLTNETIFDLTEQPKHLIVIGGGPIGIELAQAFKMLGSKVTVLEAFNIMPHDEPDCVAIVKKQLLAMGIDMHEKIQIDQINKKARQVSIKFSHKNKSHTINGSHLLVATGRRPNLQNLDLDKAEIKHSPKGIEVNRRLRSSNKKVFAIGDAAGSYQFTHIASYHAGIVLKNTLFRLPAKVNYTAVPWVTYTEPELAHVGLLSSEANQRNIKFEIVELPFADNDRAQAEHQTTGKIKLLIGKKAKILGATIVGPHAGELITPWTIAIKEGKSLRHMAEVIMPYPTLSEINKAVAGKFYSKLIFSPKVKRIVRLLALF